MKWRLIKLLCIAGAGILGALLFGDAVAGVVVAPFGWIIGRAVELGAEAKEVGVSSGEVMEVQEGHKPNQALEEEGWVKDWLEELYYSPSYSHHPININHHDPEDDFDPCW